MIWVPPMCTGSLSASIKLSLILFLLGVWAVSAPPATAQDETLTGWFTFIVADYPPESGLASEITYTLTEDSGARYELLIDIELIQPLGGPMALNRKRVTVGGEWEEVGPDETEKFWVYSIDLAPSPSPTSPEGIFAPDLFPDEPPPPRSALPAAETDSHVRGSRAWVTILCRFADATDVTPYPVSHYEQLMGSSYPSLGHYWREVSDGNLPNLNGSVVVGWYNLPQPQSYYNRGTGEFDSQKIAEDCTAAADTDVFFPDFDGINIAFNQNFGTPNHPNNALGGSSFRTLDRQRRGWGTTWLPEWAHDNQKTWAHEMGHGFGLLHSSGPYGQDGPSFSPSTYGSDWDVMSGGRSLDPYPGYGYLGVHTIAYHKDFLGWIPPDRKYTAAPNSTRTITLERLAQPSEESYLMAQIPIGRSPTDFYTVEARLFAGYDDGIPDEAIVIHKVDTTREDRLAQVVDVDNNGDPNDEGAMWTVGEIFTDAENNLQISIDATYATSYRVTINTNPDTFSTCIAFLSPSSHIFGPGEDSVSVQVEAADDCDWSARSNAAWIRVTSGGSRSGSGRASYTVTRNPHPTSRTGTLTIGGWTITVTQVGTHHLLFADDLESGTEGWGGAASWALTTASARSGARAWGWQYQGESNTSLWSPVLDLTEVESATLTFWHRFNFTGDGVSRVWVAPQNGQPGTEIKKFTGAQGWTQVSLDLSPFVGQSITLAFNMFGTTNAADSWYIDDVAVFTAGPVGYDVCTHAVSPTRQVFGPREGVASVRVEALPGCHWGATSNSPWIQITAGSSGSGPGRVSYAFAANPHSTARIGTLTVGGQTLTVIQAGANENLFEDDMESGTNGWSVNAPWALTTASARSGTHAWTDSPGGNYQNNQRATLWSPRSSIIDLTAVDSATLTFWHRYDFASGDRGNVWVAREKEDGSWVTEAVLRAFTGTNPTWQQTSFDLTPFVGARIRIVFDFISDASETADGWTIDDVAVFSTDFEMPPPPPARLENPSAGSAQSGIGIISGWACHAHEIVIELAGTPVQAAYGTPRGDTRPVCGDSNNGFSLLVNWNNLGPGEHPVRALADGVEFARTTVRVTTFGVEFLRGVSATFPLLDFPYPGDTTVVQWDESQQNFVITNGPPGKGGGYNRVAGLQAVLENPSLGSAQSGIGIISGWACAAREVVIELAGTPVQAAYGTPRVDTEPVCGDSNNGFGLLVNWNNLGAGTHTVRALIDGVEFANTTVRVTTFGVEFLRGVYGTRYTFLNFPHPGDATTLRWEEALQNFVIVP